MRKQSFKEILRQCMEKGLIEGDKLFMDATLLKANASLDSLVSKSLYCQLAKEPSAYLDDVWSSNDNDTDDGDDHSCGSDLGPRPKKQTVNRQWISKTDPDATLVKRKDTKLFLSHKVHIAVDGGRDRIITAVTTTTGTVRESRVGAALLDRHIDALQSMPAEVVADQGYSSHGFYKHLLDMGIKPSIPKAKPWKRSARKRRDAGFRYDPERDVYVCPAGKTMYRLKDVGNKKQYQVHRLACKGCPNSGSLCRAKRPVITRPLDEQLDQQVRDHLATRRAEQSIRQRKTWPETAFAELKNARGMSRAKLRGITKVQTQALMAAAAHNILKMARSFQRPLKAAEARASEILSSIAADLFCGFRLIPVKA